MKLVITKSGYDNEDNEDDMVLDAMISTVNIVRKSISDGLVKGVTDKDKNPIELEESDLQDWIFAPRIIGKTKTQVQLFIRVLTTVCLEKLITGYKQLLREENISLELKHTKYEYTKRIRIIIGPNLHFASKSVYENEIYLWIKRTNKIIKTKKAFIYKRDYKSQCIIVYATLSTYETIDKELQQMKWLDRHTKYLSFKNSDPKMRLSALYLNSLNNTSVKYKFL